ncbi:MAG: ATP-grasp domain-containing protein [Anaerolineae bacterium]|nr:ATP-grasp domain-containing protein [Anaerolineae bacterium]
MTTDNTHQTVLLVGISTRALAQSAVAAGWRVVSLDLFGDLDHPQDASAFSLTRDFGQPPELAGLAEAATSFLAQVNAVVVEAGLENEPALFELAHPNNTYSNGQAAVTRARDLERMKQTILGTGMLFPQNIYPGEALPGHGRYLIKDSQHSGGMGIQEWDGKTPPSAGTILQQFVEGDLASACFLADGKNAILVGMTRQYAGIRNLGAPPFAWCGNVAPLIDPGLENIIRCVIGKITAECGLVGMNGIDFIIKGGSPTFLEVNPRPPASFELFERLLGVNAFALHIDACQGRLPDSLPSFLQDVAWGKGILYAHQDVTVGDTGDWQSRSIADIPHPGESIPAGAPICTLIAQGDDPDNCWQSILKRAKALYREILQAK